MWNMHATTKGYVTILQWAPSYLAMPKRCSTCMPFLGNRGFFRSAAQALLYPSFHGAVGPCGWVWRGSSCPRAWRWRACSSSKRSADCGSCWNNSLERMDCSSGMAMLAVRQNRMASWAGSYPNCTTRKRQAEPVPAGSSEPGSAGTRWAAADAVQRPQRWVKWPCPVSCEACPCRLSFWFGDSFWALMISFVLLLLCFEYLFHEACVHIPWIETATRPLNSAVRAPLSNCPAVLLRLIL